MATIVVDEDITDQKDVVVGRQDAPAGEPEPAKEPSEPAQPAAEAEKPASPAPEDDGIPAKFRGKPLKDVVQAYIQLEQLAGRQGAELGALRKTHDEFIRSALEQRKAAAQSQQPEPDEESRFFLEPKKAIEDAVAKHPLVQTVYAQQLALNRQRAQQELSAKHPDWQQTLNRPDFAAFVQSNRVLEQLLVQADRDFDTAAADFVLSQYKEHQRKLASQQAATAATRKAAVDAGSVPAAGASAAAESGKPVYSRAMLIRKMQTDPEWYAAHADDILAAYVEGRVR